LRTIAHKRTKAETQLGDAVAILCNPTYDLLCTSLGASECLLKAQASGSTLQRSPGSLRAARRLVFKLGLWDALEVL